MLGFGKKKNNPPPSLPGAGMEVPTQKVLALSSQGFSEPEIVKKLRQDGFSPLQVDRAMKDAMRSGTAARPTRPAAPARPSQPATPQPPSFSPPKQAVPAGPSQPPANPAMPAGPPTPESFFSPPQQRGGFAAPDDLDDIDDIDDIDIDKMSDNAKLGPNAMLADMDRKIPEPLPFAKPPLPKDKDEREKALRDRKRRETEELTEEIVEEKWKDVMSRIQVLEENFEKLSGDIKHYAGQGGTSDASAQEIKGIKDEMSRQKESIDETNARIDSLEEVVKGSLAPMIESVRKFNKLSNAPAAASQPPADAPVPKKVSGKAAEPEEPPRYSPATASATSK